MKALFKACLVLLALCGAALAQAHISDLNSAINKAGRERMLSQRMAKAYLQLGMGVEVERSQKILEQSVSLFDRQLVELKNFAPTPDIRETYVRLEKTWIDYKDILLGSRPSPEEGRRMLKLSEEVLSLSETGVALLERHAGVVSGKLVNLSGRQRMLSQRMAKFYQALAWGAALPGSPQDLARARKDFNDALNELEGNPLTSNPIKAELALVRQQWQFFENALDAQGSSPLEKKQFSTHVATTSERILEVMEKVVSLYEGVGK